LTKNRKKKEIYIIASLIAIAFLLSSFNFVLFSKEFYNCNYEKQNYGKLYDAGYGEFAVLNEISAKQITNNLLGFFVGSNELNYFNELEASHLNDVKNIIWVIFAVYLIIIIVLLIYFLCMIKNRIKNHAKIMKLKNILKMSAVFTTGLIVLLSAVFVSFNFFFDLFHKIFFPQGNWMFPANSLLITLFPEIFFIKFFALVLFITFIKAIIAFMVAKWLK